MLLLLLRVLLLPLLLYYTPAVRFFPLLSLSPSSSSWAVWFIFSPCSTLNISLCILLCFEKSSRVAYKYGFRYNNLSTNGTLWWWWRWDATANGLQIEQIHNYILRIRFCIGYHKHTHTHITQMIHHIFFRTRTRIAFQRKIDSGVSISTSIINVNHRYYRTIMVFFFSTKLTVHLTISYLKCENKTKQSNKERRKETKSKNNSERWAWIEFCRSEMRVQHIPTEK